MTGQPIRVLFVNDHLGFAHGEMHGVARYFMNVLPRFDPSKVEATLCILRKRHPAADELEAVGVRPVFLNRRKWDPRALKDLRQFVRDREIDVLHLSGMKGCLLGRLAARATGCRAVIHLHDTIPIGLGMRILQRRLARWTDHAIAVSAAVAELARRGFGLPEDQVEVVPNGIDLSRFSDPAPEVRQRIRAELGIGSASRVVAIVGRLSEEKGHQLLIGSFPAIIARCPDAVLLVVGDGPTRRACESLVRHLELGHAVRFTGYRNDIPDVLAASDVLAMPSLREGFGYSALEAAAAGKPVVGFRVGGLPEIVVDNQMGFLVPPGDREALVDALTRVLTESGLATRLGEGCRPRAGQMSVDRHVERLQAIYASLCRQSSAGRGYHSLHYERTC